MPCSIKPEYTQKLLDKVACDILFTDYEDILKQITANNTVQAMRIFH